MAALSFDGVSAKGLQIELSGWFFRFFLRGIGLQFINQGMRSETTVVGELKGADLFVALDFAKTNSSRFCLKPLRTVMGYER
ncbi:hypothetical protein [Pseudomonas sp. IAC-BECa141]|uniref:hypothetical protein n=1 Tax=Pseudomonas sp. IAC-BECa141 TaxID=2793103 RepID=UPI001D069937|nr:hypothetical protein [Pseudomonas sp. IAC-BECa141]UDI92842.1 hypothetical protein I5961_27710 [Pseudomonas sp. IAC-BECa141]